MAQITLRGNQINTVGDLPAVGSPAPGFALTGTDLGEVSSSQFRDNPVLLNIFPSVDTPVCATSVRTFNDRAAASGAAVLCMAKDLPPYAPPAQCRAPSLTRDCATFARWSVSTWAGSLPSCWARSNTSAKINDVLSKWS